MRPPTYAKVFDTRDRTSTGSPHEGVITSRAVYLHAVLLEVAQATGNRCRLSVHPVSGGTPVVSNTAFVSMNGNLNHRSTHIVFDPPILAYNGIEYVLSVGATTTARGHIYYSEAGQDGGL